MCLSFSCLASMLVVDPDLQDSTKRFLKCPSEKIFPGSLFRLALRRHSCLRLLFSVDGSVVASGLRVVTGAGKK